MKVVGGCTERAGLGFCFPVRVLPQKDFRDLDWLMPLYPFLGLGAQASVDLRSCFPHEEQPPDSRGELRTPH